jgi:predicted GIY-YIG superfamily endonuclease
MESSRPAWVREKDLKKLEREKKKERVSYRGKAMQ